MFYKPRQLLIYLIPLGSRMISLTFVSFTPQSRILLWRHTTFLQPRARAIGAIGLDLQCLVGRDWCWVTSDKLVNYKGKNNLIVPSPPAVRDVVWCGTYWTLMQNQISQKRTQASWEKPRKWTYHRLAVCICGAPQIKYNCYEERNGHLWVSHLDTELSRPILPPSTRVIPPITCAMEWKARPHLWVSSD